MFDDQKDDAKVFLEKLLDASKSQGGGKMGIQADVIADLVRRDPNSAAKIVLAVCRRDDVPSTFAQIAMAIAVAYQNELNDDSLINEVNVAPWINRIKPPTVLTDKGVQPEQEHPLLRMDSNTIRFLEVDKNDLKTGSVKNFVDIIGVEGKSRELTAKLADLWGMCVLTFPLDADPRDVWEIPEARRFVANLHKAMPYFPGYLHFRQELGMFMVYFGCLADADAFENRTIDLNHSSIRNRLAESIATFGKVAASMGKDPRPVWRTILSPYPVSVVNQMVDKFYKQLFG